MATEPEGEKNTQPCVIHGVRASVSLVNSPVKCLIFPVIQQTRAGVDFLQHRQAAPSQKVLIKKH